MTWLSKEVPRGHSLTFRRFRPAIHQERLKARAVAKRIRKAKKRQAIPVFGR